MWGIAMDDERILDCRGLACPQPVIQTKEALGEMAAGSLRVILDNEASCTNVRRFAESQGHQVDVQEKEGHFHVMILREKGAPTSDVPPIVCEAPQERKRVVYIAAEGMGRGDDELGHTLMAAYLDTLSQFAREISHVIFVNAGVKLTVDGSPVLEELQQLERVGVAILACGTCLNHFGIKDRLRVGSVSNMYAILETLSGADKVMSP
jgi:selenium metabolism protein YedF